ncbi:MULTISPECIES: TetR/AcrR family transcriptional regulator [Shouchella]|uniref:TetR/AcrR family transcriptional regulator n=2 Tax=Shouchella TaxID=2893057 RepID=A0ABY7W3C1_9BACI|nr:MULTISPECIES: TetR/AcrR family transcriptional regulator [Shouchella]MED4130520.1 TetR/AcrR family transcriptional regulator [Shouchella miscanthi]WDF03455.1 TetR/AcrR family transcriptional regulator [Shouchella hunanensis]GAF24115.1 transcriptional regulator, TetR family [Bacillus sp. JCM 19047]
MHTTENQQVLMDAALPLLARKGFHKTKVSDIVKQAGVAQGTFYWHFKNKEAIVLHILKEGERYLLNVIYSGYRKQVGSLNDMTTSSKDLMQTLFSYAESNKDYMQLLLKTGQDSDEKIRSQIASTLQAIEQAFANNIARAQELHMLPATYSNHTLAAMLASLVFGTIDRWLFREGDSLATLNAEEMARQIVSFEFFGLRGFTSSHS